MRHPISGLLCVLAIAAFGAIQDDPPELPPGHPPTGLPSGHPPVQPTPKGPGVPAMPAADEDVRTPRAVLDAYYESMSGTDEQPRDWARFRSLFLPEGHLLAVGSGGPMALTPEQFAQVNRTYFEGTGYAERSIHEKIDTFGHIAHVLSTYESRRRQDDKPYSRGVNSFQMVHSGGRWWIVSVIWDRERGGVALPAEYLPQEGE